MTCPLIKKSDGSKFGKSEGGNIWLDKNKTSVYKFYQYWLNISDEDALSYIKVFTFLSKSQVEELILEHNKDKARRLLQNKIADTVTAMVHGQKDLNNAISASKAHDNDKQLCAATADIDEPSWWWIDLGYVQHIDKIRLFGRSDICENCLATNSMLTVRIGETLGYQNGATNTRCSDHAYNIYGKFTTDRDPSPAYH